MRKKLPPAIVQDAIDKFLEAEPERGALLSRKELFYKDEPPSNPKQFH